ncbi:C40 family peptidase [Pontibacter actiniarum]|nr:C40 family peptidase [Pontibacter actiniarum]
MKKTVLLMLFPLALLALLVLVVPQHFAGTPPKLSTFVAALPDSAASATAPLPPVQANPKRQQVVKYAMSLLGSPYVYAGISQNGFDCSGFTTHVFQEYDVAIPHSSRMQAEEGREVPREQAKPGDLVIFTGTNPDLRRPGHVGIVISQPGDTISFVHSSSNGGVKVSQVEGSRYNLRFLEVRRVL